MSEVPLDHRQESSILNLIPSAARLRGFEEDLGLTGNQFATILSILYVGYITMQVPSYEFCICFRPVLLLTSAQQEYAAQSSRETLHIPPRLHDSLGPHICPDRGYSQLCRRCADPLLFGDLRECIFPSKLPLANVPRVSSRNDRGPCSSFQNGTNVTNSGCELQSSRVAVC